MLLRGEGLSLVCVVAGMRTLMRSAPMHEHAD